MTHVTISKSAQDLILARMAEPAVQAKKEPGSVPTLDWASRVSGVDKSGNRTEYGPGFFFSWSNMDEVREYDNLLFKLPNGEDLALGPGAYFKTGAHEIDQKDGRLTLVSSD
jgi:hypothetical protein